MKTPLRRLLAGLTLTAAAATIGLTATHTTTHAPTITRADTAWGTPPTDIPTLPITPPDVDPGTLITPLDTAWG